MIHYPALVSTNWIFSLSMTHLMSHAQNTGLVYNAFLIASQQQGLTANDMYTAHSPFPNSTAENVTVKLSSLPHKHVKIGH